MKDLKKTLDHKDSLGGFIKSNEKPNQSLSSKKSLARWLTFFSTRNYQRQNGFLTTGYSDGLSECRKIKKQSRLTSIKVLLACTQQRGYEPLCKLHITNIIKTED